MHGCPAHPSTAGIVPGPHARRGRKAEATGRARRLCNWIAQLHAEHGDAVAACAPQRPQSRKQLAPSLFATAVYLSIPHLQPVALSNTGQIRSVPPRPMQPRVHCEFERCQGATRCAPPESRTAESPCRSANSWRHGTPTHKSVCAGSKAACAFRRRRPEDWYAQLHHLVDGMCCTRLPGNRLNMPKHRAKLSTTTRSARLRPASLPKLQPSGSQNGASVPRQVR